MVGENAETTTHKKFKQASTISTLLNSSPKTKWKKLAMKMLEFPRVERDEISEGKYFESADGLGISLCEGQMEWKMSFNPLSSAGCTK